MAIKIHKKEDFEKMRKAGELAAMTLDYITEYVVPGVLLSAWMIYVMNL